MIEKQPTLREFFLVVWRHWGPLMSGSFSVPFAALSVFAESSVGKLIWGMMAITAFLTAAYWIWANERSNVVKLQNRLSSKIRLFLKPDPQHPGIDIGKGPNEEDLPYVQVCAEPVNESTIYNPVANITSVEHRSSETSAFKEITSEPARSDWSRQPPPVTLSKGKACRFNIVWFSDKISAPQDVVSFPSNKLAQFYERTGKSGHYRYRVHVEGRDTAPTEAYVYVKWGASGFPMIEIEPIAELNDPL